MHLLRFALPLCLLTACVVERGSGVPLQEERTVGDFDSVSNAASLDVVVTVGADEAERVSVACDDNLVPYILTEVAGAELTIKTAEGVALRPVAPCQVSVSTPALVRLSGTGSGSTAADGELAGLTVAHNSGSGRVDARGVTTPSLAITSTGDGLLVLGGSSDAVDLTNTGLGAVEARELTSKTAAITSSGSGAIGLTVTDSADVHMTGSGLVELWGGAEVQVSNTGSGSLVQR